MFVDDIVPHNASSAVIPKNTAGLIPSGLLITPSMLWFGALVIGEDQLTREFEVKNIGKKTLRIESVELEATPQFTLLGSAPDLLKSGESFTMQVNYMSNMPGLFNGLVKIKTSEDRDPYFLMLSGRVIGSLYLEETKNGFTALVEQEAWARANAFEAEAGQRLLLEASLKDYANARVEVERIARVTEYEATVTSIENLTASLGDNEAAITDERNIRIQADEALAERITSLEVEVDNGIDSVARAAILAEQVVRAEADEAEAIARETMFAQVMTDTGQVTDAKILNERVLWVDGDEAEAAQREALKVELTLDINNKISATVDSLEQAIIDGNSAQAIARETLAAQLRGLSTSGNIEELSEGLLYQERVARAQGDAASALLVQGVRADLTTMTGLVSGVGEAVQTLKTTVTNHTGTLTSQSDAILEVSSRVTNGGNMIDNSEFMSGLSGWAVVYNTAVPVVMNKSTTIAVGNSGVMTLAQAAGTVDGTLFGAAQYANIPVIAGRKYQASVYAGSLRASVQILITFKDIAGNNLTSPFGDTNLPTEFNGGTYLAQYKRIGVMAVAPPAAVTARVEIRKYNTINGQADSIAYLTHPQFAEMRQNQTALDGYVPGSESKAMTANVQVVAQTVAAVDGKLSASYGFNVTANKRIASMKALADGTSSSIVFLADSFNFSLGNDDAPRKLLTLGKVNGVDAMTLAGNFFADGSINANALNIGVSGNLLTHASLVNGMEGWAFYTNIGNGAAAADNQLAGPDWVPTGGHQIGMYNPAGGVDSVDVLASNVISAEAGKRYEFSVYSGSHRCISYCTIIFVNSAGGYVGEASSTTNENQYYGGNGLSNWKRVFGFGVAPPGTTGMCLQLRKARTLAGQSNSYSFFTQPMIAEASIYQTQPSKWSAGGLGVKITPAGISTPSLAALSANLGMVTAGDFNLVGGNGLMRSNSKNWSDGGSGFIFGRGSDGSTYTDLQASGYRIWMSSWGDCGIIFPGFSVIGGVLTINQLNVIDTSNIVPDAVTALSAAYTDGQIQVISSPGVVAQEVYIDLKNTNAPVQIRINMGFSSTGNGGQASTGAWRLVRDGQTLRQYGAGGQNGVGSSQVNLDMIDYPGIGGHTYQVIISATSNSVAGAFNRFLSAQAVKR